MKTNQPVRVAFPNIFASRNTSAVCVARFLAEAASARNAAMFRATLPGGFKRSDVGHILSEARNWAEAARRERLRSN